MKFELTHKEDTSSHTWTCLSKPVLVGKENHRKDAGTWLSFVPSEPYCPQCGKRFEKFTRL